MVTKRHEWLFGAIAPTRTGRLSTERAKRASVALENDRENGGLQMDLVVHTEGVSSDDEAEVPKKQRASRWTYVDIGANGPRTRRLPVMVTVTYRGGVAVKYWTGDRLRRMATPFRVDEREAVDEALHTATKNFDWAPKTNQSVRDILVSRASFARSRANTRLRDYDLDLEWLCGLYDRQGGLCAVTGLPFDIGVSDDGNSKWRRPFRPSLDRIDSSKGYTRDNVRLVCSAVNNAMGAWGEAVFAVIAQAFMTRQRP